MRELNRQMKALDLLLKDPKLDTRETIFLLHDAWVRLVRMVSPNPNPHKLKRTRRFFGSGPAPSAGPDQTVVGELFGRSHWVADEAERYYRHQPISVSEEKVLESFADLKRAHRITEKWVKKTNARGIRTVGAILFRGMFAALLILCFSVGIWGIGEFLSRPPESSGLSATYFKRPDFSGHPFMTREPRVHFEWDERPPVPGFGQGAFSVTFEGSIRVPGGERVALGTTSRNLTHRVEVGGKIVLDATTDLTPKTVQSKFEIVPGVQPISIACSRVDYPSLLKLQWIGKNGETTPVKGFDLIPAGSSEGPGN